MNNAMKNGTNVATKAMSASFESVAKTALKVFTAVKALSQLKDFAKSCIEDYKAAEEAATKLEAVLENVNSIKIRGPNAAKEAAANLNNVASKLQKIGVIEADTVVAGMQQLATFQLSDKEISVLSSGMTDLLAQQKGLNATQKDAVTIGNMIGKAMSGNAGALSRVGISFSEAQKKSIQLGTSTERAATIAEVLKQNVGGVNEALARTDQGKIQQSENVLGDMKETLGGYILPFLATIYSKSMPYIVSGFDKITAALDVVGPTVEKAFVYSFGKVELAIQKITPMLSSIYKHVIPYIVSGISRISSLSDDVSPKIVYGISNVIGTVSSQIPTIIAGVSSLKPAIESVIDILKAGYPRIISLANSIIPMTIRVLSSIIPIIASIGVKVLNAGVMVGNAIDQMYRAGALVPLLASVGSAFAVVKIVKFAKTLISTTKAFITASKAIALLRIEKIKDKAETLYLNVLYAKDAVIKGASTAATYAQTAAMTVWNGVCGVATAVTTALGAAFTFLTSPIGLVILAITAVIAIGVLLYKNWDLVKAKALQLGSNIKLVFQSIKVKITAVLSWLQQRFPAVFSVLNVYITAWKTNISAIITGIRTVFNGLITFIKSVFAGNWSAAWDSIVSIFTGIFSTIATCAKTPLNAMIGLVNTAINGINGLTGVINKIPGVNIGEIPNIPYLANGATVTKPTLAMIGEAGPETVVPHNNKPRSQALLAAATMGVTGGSSASPSDTVKSGNTINFTYAPTINGSNVYEIEETLQNKFEEFKMYAQQFIEERERECFG